MTTQSFHCPRCQTTNAAEARFCSQCGLPFTQQPQSARQVKNTKAVWITVGILVAVLGSCGLCGVIGKLSENSTKRMAANSNQTSKPSPTVVPSPTATPKPTFAELQQRSEPLLTLEKEEYVRDDLGAFDAVIGPLRQIPKDAKEYAAAQALIKKLIDKSARITAEILVLGPKPKNSEWDGRVDPVVEYLKNNLNDYDSSEFVEWSPVTKLEVKGEPFWVVRLKLRAKNAFGGYVLKNTFYFIRQNRVVTAEGL
jgi:hypothetical protein